MVKRIDNRHDMVQTEDMNKITYTATAAGYTATINDKFIVKVQQRDAWEISSSSVTWKCTTRGLATTGATREAAVIAMTELLVSKGFQLGACA